MRLTLALLFVFSILTSNAQNSVSVDQQKVVKGVITYLNEPVPDVSIVIRGTTLGTKTSDNGEYSLNVSVGDILEYSHVSYQTVHIVVEDVTSVLNISLEEKVNLLKEAVVEARPKSMSLSEFEDKMSMEIKTSVGTFTPNAIGSKVHYLKGDQIGDHYQSLSQALAGKFSGTIPSQFDVDGVLYQDDSAINVNTIKELWILKGGTGTMRWGGPVVIVRTFNSSEDVLKENEKIAEGYRNQNRYTGDATDENNSQTLISSSLKENIKGRVTYLNNPLPDANILIKGTSKGTKSDVSGFFELEVETGSILEISYLGYKTVEIKIENNEFLLVEMVPDVDQLDEVVINSQAPKGEYFKEIETAGGKINPMMWPSTVYYFNQKDLGTHHPSISEALKWKIPRGKIPSIFDIDGVITRDDSSVDLSNVLEIYVISGSQGTMRWGGPVVIVRTFDNPQYIRERNEQRAKQYQNQNLYQFDGEERSSDDVLISSKLEKTITGQVTYLGDPLPETNIIVQGTSRGTATDKDGKFSIQARIGDVLQFSHVGYQPISILVEDVTTVLNVEMQADKNQLQEAVVTARKTPKSVSELERKMNVDLVTPFGNFNPSTSGDDIRYVPGKSLNLAGGIGSLNGKIAGLSATDEGIFIRTRPAKLVIDGRIGSTIDLQNLDPALVEDIYIIKTRALVVIRTKNDPTFITQKKAELAEKYTNQEYYNNDAETKSETFTSSVVQKPSYTQLIEKEISGQVTYLDAPVPLVNVRVVGKNSGVVTNPKGEYTITANVGDIIQFSHVSYATVSIMVEDVTEILDIELVLQENELETVVIEADSRAGRTLERIKEKNKSFNTSRGTFNPETDGSSNAFIDEKDNKANSFDILDYLNGKVAGLRINRETNEVLLRSTGSVNTDVPPIWDIDGNIIDYIPPINPDDIKSVRILKSLASTTRYGTIGRGGVIVIETKNGRYEPSNTNINKVAQKYQNQDYYSNDAADISMAGLSSNPYADSLEEFESKQKAFIHYEEKLKYSLPSYADHIAIAQKFVTHFKDLTFATEIFKSLMNRYTNDPEVLKAIAYHLQTIGSKQETIEAYERTFKLRPQYAQSYRDLANAYMENDQFKKSWRLYMSYLMQGHDLSEEGIGELIYNEMEWLFFSRKNQTEIRENFIPKSKDIMEFRNDVRMVFEWNTSEAEFDLEFVSPDLRAYVFEHTLAANQELITAEKQKGFSSKEFFIEELGDGEWLVNMVYKGNKKPEPTYFKVTTFYNWGKAEQSKEVSVYKFQNERNKIQLKKFHRDGLLPNR